MNEILIVDNLNKTFKLNKKRKQKNNENSVKVAVENLNFTSYAGEIFGLLGPNGAGKTTTMRMLATLIKPNSGDAIIDGVSITKNPNKVRSKIGFLTSELRLDDYFTPDYLFDFFSGLYGIEKNISIKRKNYLFEHFGISEFSDVKIANLSQGMKQKISLVISIVHDPSFIIFDEPTNGLDIITARTVTDFLLELKNQGKSIIVSTHIFSLIEKICDRVGIIIDGKMVACDKLTSMTESKCLEDVFFETYDKIMGTGEISYDNV